MADESPDLAGFYQSLRENEKERRKAIDDLEAIGEFYAEIGEPDPGLNEYVATQRINDDKLDRALTKRGY